MILPAGTHLGDLVHLEVDAEGVFQVHDQSHVAQRIPPQHVFRHGVQREVAGLDAEDLLEDRCQAVSQCHNSALLFTD